MGGVHGSGREPHVWEAPEWERSLEGWHWGGHVLGFTWACWKLCDVGWRRWLEFRGRVFCFSWWPICHLTFWIRFIIYLNPTLFSERYQVLLCEHTSLLCIFNLWWRLCGREIRLLYWLFAPWGLCTGWAGLLNFLPDDLFYCVLPSGQNPTQLLWIFEFIWKVTEWKMKSESHRNLDERTRQFFDLWASYLKIL